MLAACATTPGATYTSAGDVDLAPSRAAMLRQDMRKLWSDHVVWTRGVIVAAAEDDPSLQTQLARLMRNQEDLGNAIAPYYGNDAGAKLTSLLKDHIQIAVDLVTAAKAGDAAKQADADKRWHDNAADLATFLAGANPNWQRQALLDMLNQHLALTTTEAVNRLQHNWTDDVSTFDKVYAQAMMMADALTDGIVKQFPTKV
jgi:hypothetical protein